MKRTSLLIITFIAMQAALLGCRGRARQARDGAIQPYYGVTKSFEEVVAGINRNNSKVPTLWARHSFEATIVDRERNRRNEVVGDGALLYRRPRGFLLKGVRPGMTLFEMGSTEERYWLTLVPEADSMWWGEYENLYKPCAQEPLKELMPIRPDLVLEVLGIGLIDTNFAQPPVPTMRFNHDRRAYMFVWNIPTPRRWWAQREVWYDMNTLLPTLVLLFDENGRVVLRARLSDHQPIELEDLPQDQWPRVATEYRLFFPDTGTSMWISLSDMQLDKNGTITRRNAIRFPNLERPGVANVIQIDEGCNDE